MPEQREVTMLSTGLCAQLACIWEVVAQKPGNVSRYYDFDKTSFVDYLVSAAAIAPVIGSACHRRVGETVLEGVRATRQVVGSNTNLGILMLLAPLASVPRSENLETGVPPVLRTLDERDAVAFYEAIQLAKPGGLGHVEEEDVSRPPTRGLLEIMKLAANRDLIARQYVNNFKDVFEVGVPALRMQLDKAKDIESAIVYCQLKFMATYPDSLIARKCGLEEANTVKRLAANLLENGWPDNASAETDLQDLDEWLRALGNRRNPGTSADLVTASLFVLLREGTIDEKAIAFQP